MAIAGISALLWISRALRINYVFTFYLIFITWPSEPTWIYMLTIVRQTDDYSGGKWPCYKATRLLTSLNLSGLSFPPEKNSEKKSKLVKKGLKTAIFLRYPCYFVIECEQGSSKMYGHVESVNTYKHHINKHYYIMITFWSKTFLWN